MVQIRLSKIILLALISILLTSCIVKDNDKRNSLQRQAINTRNESVIIVFNQDVELEAVMEANGEITKEFEHIPAVSAQVPADEVIHLKNDPNISVVEPDRKVSIHNQTTDWGIQHVQAARAWENGLTGKGVNIAVVDTGIANHEDLNISGGTSFTPYTSSFLDDNGHGTHVAGIISANQNSIGTVGIAYDANIYAIKVLDQDGNGPLSNVISGIEWSITNKMDIINLSLGMTTHSTALQQVVEKAEQAGIIVVAAAGNNGLPDGTGDTVNYPARYDTVIGVSALNSKNERASFSATGNTIEVAAPGEGILSTHLGGKYSYMSGTSMAAPYVSGNLALLKQAYPELNHNEIRLKLQQNVVDIGDRGRDSWFGYGLIQAPLDKGVPYTDKNQSTYDVPPGFWDANHRHPLARLHIRQAVPLLKKESNGTFVGVNILRRGEYYRTYGVVPSHYHVGGGYYVKHEQEKMNLLLGRLFIRADTTLYKPNGAFHRSIKPGELIRVYNFDEHTFQVGGGYYIKNNRKVLFFVGYATLKLNTPLYTHDGQIHKVLNKGDRYPVYSIDVGKFNVGGGYYILDERTHVAYMKN